MIAAEIVEAMRASPALCSQVLETLCIADPWKMLSAGRFRISVVRPTKVVGHVWCDGGLWCGWALDEKLDLTFLSAEDAERAVDAVLVRSGWTVRGGR